MKGSEKLSLASFGQPDTLHIRTREQPPHQKEAVWGKLKGKLSLYTAGRVLLTLEAGQAIYK